MTPYDFRVFKKPGNIADRRYALLRNVKRNCCRHDWIALKSQRTMTTSMLIKKLDQTRSKNLAGFLLQEQKKALFFFIQRGPYKTIRKIVLFAWKHSKYSNKSSVVQRMSHSEEFLRSVHNSKIPPFVTFNQSQRAKAGIDTGGGVGGGCVYAHETHGTLLIFFFFLAMQPSLLSVSSTV